MDIEEIKEYYLKITGKEFVLLPEEEDSLEDIYELPEEKIEIARILDHPFFVVRYLKYYSKNKSLGAILPFVEEVIYKDGRRKK